MEHNGADEASCAACSAGSSTAASCCSASRSSTPRPKAYLGEPQVGLVFATTLFGGLLGALGAATGRGSSATRRQARPPRRADLGCGERRVGLRHEPLDDLADGAMSRRGQPARRRVVTSAAPRRPRTSADTCRIHRFRVCLELIDRGAQRSRGGRSARRQIERERRHHALAAGPSRPGGVGRDDALLPGRVDGHLRRSPGSACRADCLGAPSASAAAIPRPSRDAAGGRARRLAGEVNHLRHQHHRRHPAGVAARLPALATQDVGARLVDLADGGRPPLASRGLRPRVPRRSVARDAHVEGDDRRRRLQMRRTPPRRTGGRWLIANGRPVSSRSGSTARAARSGERIAVPTLPRPPAFETAAASST